ncbi:MAG: RagB/SusD family nutrient uptake outer membrane protein [Bacteroidales bacterium]
MRNRLKLTAIYFLATMLFWSCESYLDKTPDADISEKDVFSTYENFQGFADGLYACIVDPNSFALTTGSENGDESIAVQGWASARKFAEGNYWDVIFNNWQSNCWNEVNPTVFGATGKPAGIWPFGWKGIRLANQCLENLQLLQGTQEQADLIEGQAYFFRAYLHWEIAVRWGGIPYADKVFAADENLDMPRLTFQETVERIVEDLDRAAELLPENWDMTSVGSSRTGFNMGRATKGAALAYKAKTLLFAGSPLMVHDAGGAYQFDTDYMVRAANAAWEVIKLADNGVYDLVPFEEYEELFARMDGTTPWTTETIWANVPNKSSSYNNGIGTPYGVGMMGNRLGRLYTPARFGGNDICETPVQDLVDKYEMSNGLHIDEPGSGYDPMDPWSNRDPRFRQFIYVDGDMAGVSPQTQLQLFEGGIDKNEPGVLTSYINHKYWPKGVNKIDQLWSQFTYATPLMRLADVYLIYAEAVNEAFGPTGTAEGASLTAVEAVNIVRSRSLMPGVPAQYAGSQDAFREKIRNERSVELCFEGSRWNDMRRWYIAHLPEYKVQHDLVFDQGHTSFTKVVIFNRVFEQRHYWLPFYKTQVQLYSGWPQNPGW